MDRRTVLKGVGLTAATAGTAGLAACGDAGDNAADGPAAPAVTRRRRELKMVTTWPKGLPGLGTLAENTARRITEGTEGELDIRVYAADELVGAFESFDAVSVGNADMYHGAEYYWQGKSKGFTFFTSVPFGLNAAEFDAWIQFGGGQELWDELSARFNIKALTAGNTGVQMGGWYNKTLETLDDFNGLKVRMPGLGGEVMRRLGAAAVSRPGNQIYQALQTNEIDAAEWVGPWNDLALGFHRVARYYYYPGFHEPGAALALGINKDVWESFTPWQQSIVNMACQAETNANLAEFNRKNAGALRTLIEAHDVELRRFSDEVLSAIGEASGQVLREAAAEEEITGRIFESFLKARRIGIEWGAISEEAFAGARRLPFSYG